MWCLYKMRRERKGPTEQSQRKPKVPRTLTQRKGATMDYFYVPNVIKKICISQKKLLKLWNTWIHNSLPIFFYQTTTGTWRLRPETPLETEQMSNMQIKWLFIQAWRTKIFHVESHILYLNHGLIFFCLFHRLNYIICYVPDFFLPSNSKQKSACVSRNRKKEPHV